MTLKGQALQLVQGLPITTENYSTAWNMLVGRYKNTKFIAASYVRQILGLRSISREDVGDMRQFVNTFCSNFKSLKALNIEHMLEDIILSQLVVECLESQTRHMWQMKQVDKGFPTLKELITFMEQKCKDLETLKPSTNTAHLMETQVADIPQRRSWVQKHKFFSDHLWQGYTARIC